jgi:hypothetical protein
VWKEELEVKWSARSSRKQIYKSEEWIKERKNVTVGRNMKRLSEGECLRGRIGDAMRVTETEIRGN